MAIKYFIMLGILTILSCTSTESVKPILPEIDFSSANYLTPSDLSKFKSIVGCNETPYWEGKKVKLQGFVFSGNIDTKAKKFFLYDNIKVFEPSNKMLEVYYESKDSAITSKALLDNSDKHCLIKVTCSSWQECIFGRDKPIQFTITKPEDLEFK